MGCFHHSDPLVTCVGWNVFISYQQKGCGRYSVAREAKFYLKAQVRGSETKFPFLDTLRQRWVGRHRNAPTLLVVVGV